MNETNTYEPIDDPKAGINARDFSVATRLWQQIFLTMIALLATAVSLGIAMYAGWHLGGLLYERVMYLALFGVVVMYVHLLPMCRRALVAPARMGAAALWCVGLMVVLYGQVMFFLMSQQHAGNIRAASVPATIAADRFFRHGRSPTEIAQEAAKVSADLARMKMRRCIGDCPTLSAREVILDAQLAALKTEAEEAKRRETDEDRWNKKLDRYEDLRATLRSNPVASQVASWLGTTEDRVELVHAFSSAVVLEGAAIVIWLLAVGAQGRKDRSEASGADYRSPARVARDGSKSIAQSRGIVATTSGPIATATKPVIEIVVPSSSPADLVAPNPKTEKGADCATDPASEMDELVAQLERDVAAGLLHPTQDRIRRHLGCSQKKAGKLRRLLAPRLADQRLAT